jgi:transposase
VPWRARSVPGVGDKGGPLAVAVIGRAGRFPDADAICAYTGLVPRASETGETDHKGQPMTKAGNRKMRRMLYLAADTARKEDPQLARIYWVQMVERGANHTKALAVVAAHLARRLWRTLERQGPSSARRPTSCAPPTAVPSVARKPGASSLSAGRWTRT